VLFVPGMEQAGLERRRHIDPVQAKTCGFAGSQCSSR
jgi:hypothetical protein